MTFSIGYELEADSCAKCIRRQSGSPTGIATLTVVLQDSCS